MKKLLTLKQMLAVCWVALLCGTSCVPAPPPLAEDLIQIIPSNDGKLLADGFSQMTIQVKLDVREGATPRKVTLTTSAGRLEQSTDGTGFKAEATTDKKTGTAVFYLNSPRSPQVARLLAEVQVIRRDVSGGIVQDLKFRQSIEVEFLPSCPESLTLGPKSRVVLNNTSQQFDITATVRRELGKSSPNLPVTFTLSRVGAPNPSEFERLVPGQSMQTDTKGNILTDPTGTAKAILQLDPNVSSGQLKVVAEVKCKRGDGSVVSKKAEQLVDLLVCADALEIPPPAVPLVLEDKTLNVPIVAKLKRANFPGAPTLGGIPVTFTFSPDNSGGGNPSSTTATLTPETPVTTDNKGEAKATLSISPSETNSRFTVKAETTCGGSSTPVSISRVIPITICPDSIELKLSTADTIDVTSDTKTIDLTAEVKRAKFQGLPTPIQVTFEVKYKDGRNSPLPTQVEYLPKTVLATAAGGGGGVGGAGGEKLVATSVLRIGPNPPKTELTIFARFQCGQAQQVSDKQNLTINP